MVDPVRGVGQALDAVEVGHVVVLGLGQVFAEVAIALSPDVASRSTTSGWFIAVAQAMLPPQS